MRRGLRLILEQQVDFQVLGEANDGREAMSMAESLKPDVAVLDITMPNLNGIEAARQISAKHPGVAIVILSMHADEGYVLRALKAGARGYLLKESPEADFIQAVRAVSEGKAFFRIDADGINPYQEFAKDKDGYCVYKHRASLNHWPSRRSWSPAGRRGSPASPKSSRG